MNPNPHSEVSRASQMALQAQTDAAAARLIRLAAEKQVTICSCESFTAGLFCSELGSVPGASAVLKGGLVTYFTEMKETLAHVDPALIETYGVVSIECAAAMASNTRHLMDADYCVAFTGNAGPGAQEGKPAGMVYCALADAQGVDWSCWQMDLPRNALRLKAVLMMIEKLIETIEAG